MTLKPAEGKKRNLLKRTLSVFLTAVLLFSVFISALAAAQTQTLTDFYVTVIAENAATQIHWWYDDAAQTYRLFLPADADRSALQIGFCADAETIAVDGKEIQNGEMTDALANGSSFTLECGGKTYALSVLQSASLPSVYIETESGTLANVHADKSHKEPARITVVENGEVTLDNVKLSHIKGRGNSTWAHEKKPYNIKFEKKTDLFGMGKAKKWTLLASADDEALIRNPAAFYIAEHLGMDYTSLYRFADLYINGEYLGNYIICESVEVGSTRVDIEDLEDANEEANPDVDIEDLPTANTGSAGDFGSKKWAEIPNDPTDISGGYLLEFDFRYNAEVSGFVSQKGQPVVIKSPEYASRAEVTYISELFNAAEEALYSADGYNSKGKHYSDYFDMQTFIAQYLLCEFVNDIDSGLSSFFLYKDAGNDKFHFSPAWDYDRALGHGIKRDVNSGDPSIWWANAIGNADMGYLTIYAVAFQDTAFRTAAAQAWNNSFLAGESGELLAFLRALAGELRASAIMDRIRWKIGDAQTAGSDFDAAVKTVLTFIKERVKTLNGAFSAPVAMLYYDANGGSGFVFNHQIAHVGDKVKITEGSGKYTVQPADENTVLDGWNTKPDGSGKTYRANENILLEEETTVLYAVWKSFGSGFFGKVRAFFYLFYRMLMNLQILLRNMFDR